jgi:hypothetical protein
MATPGSSKRSRSACPDGDQRELTKGTDVDIEKLAELLREAEEHHGPYEASAPKHHWSWFYAAYIVAREQGRSPEEADRDARSYMDGILAKQGGDS